MGSRPYTVLDVGANHGEFSLEVARRRPNVRVLAIEPIPELANEIKDKAAEEGLLNHEVLTLAIAHEAGRQGFNVSVAGDNGISSLLSLDTRAIASNEYWRERPDLVLETSIQVEVVPLYDVIRNSGIPSVDFIKIDAQGLDLEVLMSAGTLTHTIRAGMLEVPTIRGNRLYGEETQDLQTALNLLANIGFNVYAIKPNDPACNEVNVYFCRPDEDPTNFESELGLVSLPIYDGKHFWAVARSTYGEAAAVERMIQAASASQDGDLWQLLSKLRDELERAGHELRRAELNEAERVTTLRDIQRSARDLRDHSKAVEHEMELMKHRNRELANIVQHLSKSNLELTTLIRDSEVTTPPPRKHRNGGHR